MKHSPSRIEYAAAPAVVAGLTALAAVFGGFAATEGRPAGRLLLGVAAAVCAAEALRCALVRPVLAADAEGLEVALITGLVRIPWDDVEDVRQDVTRRRGSTARSLTVDVGDTVHTVAAHRLGAPVAEIVSALEGLRSRRPG